MGGGWQRLFSCRRRAFFGPLLVVSVGRPRLAFNFGVAFYLLLWRFFFFRWGRTA